MATQETLVLHRHCDTCVKILRCTVRPQEGHSCVIVACDLGCGARFHACKKEEHSLLCPSEKVPCINAVNGCPVWLPRCQTSRHLERCPASVVMCTMEWNRWPVCSRERQMHIPFKQPNPHAKQGQLDVALALRDQRMLNEWMRVPRRTRRTLQNNLTRRFPAVPIHLRGLAESDENSSHTTHPLNSEDDDTPSEVKRAPPGLQRSVCGELYKASLQASESLTAALTMIISQNGVSEDVARADKNRTAEHFSKETVRCNGSLNDLEMDSAGKMAYAEQQIHAEAGHKSSVSDRHFVAIPSSAVTLRGWCNGEKDTTDKENVYLNAKKSYLAFVDGENYMNDSTEVKLEKAVNGLVDGMETEAAFISTNSLVLTTHHQLGTAKSLQGEELSIEIPSSPSKEINSSCGVLFVDDTVVSDISSASMTDHARKPPTPPPPPPPPSPPLIISLGLDLTLESITRYQTKPKSMYTFLCAQEFRRDEYAWHYKNVHSDIHGGLNGWLEQRCPLAQYGCMYSMRRFYPTSNGSTVIHNDILESFGVTPCISYDVPLCKHHSPETSSIAANVERNWWSPGCDRSSCCVSSGLDIVAENPFSPTVPTKPTSLCHLPFEVLQHICRFLDGFSLCNLALTSCLLRDVCRSLLEERGIVVLQWEKKKAGNSVGWRIGYKRWLFSTAFSAVQYWGFVKHHCHMSDHLRACTYFHRNLKEEPYYYPMGAEPDKSVYDKLVSGITPSDNQSVQPDCSS